MPNIGNDSELRQFIDSLSFAQQRALGVRFAQGVIDLTQDPRLTKALETALTPGVSAPELEGAYKTAKAISTATFTACGRDADWMAQAEHFSAAALQAALAPADQLPGRARRPGRRRCRPHGPELRDDRDGPGQRRTASRKRQYKNCAGRIRLRPVRQVEKRTHKGE